MQKTDQTVLITGGAVRLGRIMVTALAEQGCRLVIHYHSSAREAETLAKELKSHSIEFVLVKADLANPSGVMELVEQIPSDFLPVTTLINSAAIFPDDDKWGRCSEIWDKVMNVNARAPILLAEQLFSDTLNSQTQVQNSNSSSQSFGRNIINILDARVSRNQADRPIYRWSKALLWQATQDLALSLAPKVRVNGIALGAMLPPPGADDLHMRRLRQSIPLRQTGNAESLIQAVNYLMQQSFVTGEVLRLDGGEFL